MAVEKYYKDSNGEYIKVIQESENLTQTEEAKLRNQLQGKKPSIRKKITNKIQNQKTTAGRPIYIDPKTGENYSEKSTTFQTEDGKWITMPTVNTEGGQFDVSFLEDFVKRNGAKDPLTGRDIPLFETEEEAVNYAKERSNSLTPQRRISNKLYDSRGRFRGADYKTGVNNDVFRMGFSGTNNFKEKVNFLDKEVGKNGYVVDRMGNFLLTQEGRSKIGQEGSNLLAIDAERFESEDFSDFFGEFGEVLAASVVGEVAADAGFRKVATSNSPIGRLLRKGHLGKANKLASILGKTMNIVRPTTRIAANAAGAAGGAYVGNVLAEAEQFRKGISEESWKDIQARGITEAKLAGSFAVLGQLAAKGIGKFVKTKGATKFTKEVYGEQAYKNWQETGILKADENSIMDRINKGYLVDLYNEIDSPRRARLMSVVDAITRSGRFRDAKNAQVAMKELKKEFPVETKGFTDQQLIETLEMYINGEGKLLQKALKMHRAGVGAAAADGLGALLRLSQKGEIPINDIADMYDTINQAVALSSVEAMKTAEVLGRKGLQNVDELFVGLDEALDTMGARIKDIKGSSSDITNNSINYLQGLKGNQNVEDLRFLIGDNGDVLLVTTGGSQNFIGTQRISQELAKVKGKFKDVVIEEGGPLAKLWDNIDPETGQPIKPLYISPAESNLLIQQMRRISLDGVQGSKFDTRKLWDAAIQDNDIATAALDNAINQAKAGKIKARPGSDKNLISKGLSQMDEYNASIKKITDESKNQMKIFEEYGLGELAIRVADGEINYNNLIDVLLDPNTPENLESFMKFFTDTIKKQRKAIYKPSKQMPDEYLDIALDDAGQPIRTVTGVQKTAYDAIQSGPMDSDVAEAIFKPGSRPADKLAQEGKINFVNSNMSVDEIENFVRDELKRATLRRMVNEDGQLSLKNIRRVIEELGVDDIGKPGAKNSLVSIFGEKTAKELLDFSKKLDNVILGIDVPPDIAKRLQDGLGQVNRVINEANPQGLDEALENFSKAQRDLDKYNKNQFKQNLIDNEYVLKEGADMEYFLNDLFSGEMSTKQLEKIIDNMLPKKGDAPEVLARKKMELESLQSRVINKFIRDLGEESLDVTDEITIQDVANMFSNRNLSKTMNSLNPQRFNIIFQGVSDNPFQTLKRISNAAKKSGQKNTMGNLVAAAFAMTVAGAPIGAIIGALTFNTALLGASMGVIAMSTGATVLSLLLRNKQFMKFLTKSTLPQKTLTKGELGRQITAKTLRDLTYLTARDRQGDRDRMGPSATDIKKIRDAQGIKQRTSNIADRLANTGSQVLAAGPNIANNLVNQFTGGSRKFSSRYKTPTRLPNVQTFDDTIFTEIDRRRALAGNNPKNQDLVRRR